MGGNEKGFKGTGERGRGPGGNWETLGGNWGRMRRASMGLGEGTRRQLGGNLGGNEKGFKGIGGKGTRRQLRANEKGFKGTGGRGRGPGGNWETLGGKWGRMRRASRGLGQGDQEATGRHWDGSGGE